MERPQNKDREKTGVGKKGRERGQCSPKISQDTDSVIYEKYEVHKESSFVQR